MWNDLERFSISSNNIHPLIHLLSTFNDYISNTQTNNHSYLHEMLLKIPTLDKNSIYSLRNDLINDTDIKTAFEKIKFYYEFDIDFFKKFLSNYSDDIKYSIDFDYIIYFQIVAFFYISYIKVNN